MGRSERGIGFAGSEDDIKGLIILPSAEIDVPGKSIGLYRNRVQTPCQFDLLDAFVKLPAVRQYNAEQRVGPRITRAGGDGLAEVFLRFRRVPVVARNYAEHHQRLRLRPGDIQRLA